ncbi:MAG: M20/M25/M40 family metallo-hydrolase [Saprospiraceae bacterium]
MTSKSISLLFLILICLISDVSAQISKPEMQIVAAVDKRSPAALDLLKKVVNINSGTMNFEGVRKVGNIFMEELKAIGFETRWSPGESFNRAGHLIAVHVGKKNPKILLIGHLDTVFESDSPFQEYKMLNDSIMNGPGASDMKGGDVVMILALQALKDSGLLEDMSIEIVMTGDEELSGEPIALSKKDIVDAAIRADIALGYEDGDGLSTTAVISRRGSADWTLKVKGVASHSSQIFTEKVGTGAIYEASRILNEFYTTLSREENLTFNPGVIIGGSTVSFDEDKNTGTAFGKNNVVAQDVIVRGDLRAFSKDQLAKAKKIMTDIVANNYPMTSAIIEFGEDAYPPMSLTEGNKQLLSYLNYVSLDLGFGPEVAVNPRKAGAADISFAADHVEMAMDGIGLPGGDGHTINETGNIRFLPIEAKRSAVLMYRLVHGTADSGK